MSYRDPSCRDFPVTVWKQQPVSLVWARLEMVHLVLLGAILRSITDAIL